LDVSAGRLSRIAESAQAFEKMLTDPAFVEDYLCLQFVEHLGVQGMVLKQNQIYSYRVPLALGGEARRKTVVEVLVGRI
jgi:hypothetical protein